MTYALIFSKRIRTDFRSVLSYIREELKAVQAAKRLEEEIESKLEYLEDFPLAAPLAPDAYLASLGVRMLLVGNYLLVYKVLENEKAVNVLRFIYSRRDWRRLLKQ